MFGFNNYDKPGKGVEKRDPNQPRISLFFELFFLKLWDLCKTNMLYILLIIPTFVVIMFVVGAATNRLTEVAGPIIAQMMNIYDSELMASMARFDLIARIELATLFVVFLGAGPVTAGVTYAVRNYAREEHVWLWSDIWRNIKSNFKQSILLWFLDLIVFVAIINAVDFYCSMSGMGIVALCVLLPFVLLYLMMHIYVYQIMITFKLPFKHIIKNSVIMALMTIPKTLLMLVILGIVHIIIPSLIIISNQGGILLIVFILLEVFFLPVASMLTTNFFIINVT